MTKHHQYYQLMRQNNEGLFVRFSKIHQLALQDPETLSAEFHHVGTEFIDVCRFWERKLCSGMERGKFAQYSHTLAEKFWQLIKTDFPLIDQVGVIKKIVNTSKS